MKIAFHLRFELMAWAGSGLRRNVLYRPMNSYTLALLLLLVFRLESSHCGTQYFYFYLVGNAKLNGITFEAYNCAEQPAARDHFVPVFKGGQHFLGFLLAPLRGKDQQHVKDYHDDQQRRESHQAAGACGLRHQ